MSDEDSRCDAQGFKDNLPSKALDNLVRTIESYFAAAVGTHHAKVMCTTLPPVYFQRPGKLHYVAMQSMDKYSSRSPIMRDRPLFDHYRHRKAEAGRV